MNKTIKTIRNVLAFLTALGVSQADAKPRIDYATAQKVDGNKYNIQAAISPQDLNTPVTAVRVYDVDGKKTLAEQTKDLGSLVSFNNVDLGNKTKITVLADDSNGRTTLPVSFVEASANTQTAVVSQVATPVKSGKKAKATPTYDFETFVSELSPEAAKDFKTEPGKTLKDLKGSSFVVIGDYGGNKQIDVDIPKAIVGYAAPLTAADFYWELTSKVDGKNQVTRLKFKDGSLVDFLTGEKFDQSKFNPEKKPFKVEAPPQLSGNKDNKLIMLYKDQIEKNGWNKIFFNPENHYGDSKGKEAINPKNYDGIYVVFNNNVKVGGVKGLYVRLTPFKNPSLDSKQKVKDEKMIRDLDISELIAKQPDLEERIANASGKTPSVVSSGAFEQTRIDVSAGYGSRKANVTVPILDGRGRVIRNVQLEGSANGVEVSTDSRLGIPTLLDVKNGYVAFNGNALFGSAKDSSDALQVSTQNGKGSANAGYFIPMGAVNVALEAGLAGLFEKYDVGGNIGILGPDGKVVLSVPSINTEVSGQWDVLGKGKYHNAQLGVRTLIKDRVKLEGSAAQSSYNGIHRRDFDGKATAYFVPGLGIYVSYGQGQNIDVDSNDAKLKDTRVSTGVNFLLK